MMTVSVVVGGQYGSEGKGKVALALVRRRGGEAVAVRVGGPNSGHTGIRASDRRKFALRQIPAGAIDGAASVVLPAGCYIDVDLLEHEIAELGIDPERVIVSAHAHLIDERHRVWEAQSGLVDQIGSTGSGTGAAVLGRLMRGCAPVGGMVMPPSARMAGDEPRLARFVVDDTTAWLRTALERGAYVMIEGTQGFGLSLLHSPHFPKVTSRDTSAAATLAEAGLSPMDVGEIVLALRCHPIRVAGASGPLTAETSWEEIAREGGIDRDIREYTTVTKKERRVGRFDAELVRAAIAANQPSLVALNHLSYVDERVGDGVVTERAQAFVREIEALIERRVDLLGLGPDLLVDNPDHQLGAA